MATARKAPPPSGTLIDQAVALAWGAWTELGVSGWTATHRDWAVDPEPLVLFTGRLGDTDPRLRDEATDWCVQHWRYVSKTRLKNLQRRQPVADAGGVRGVRRHRRDPCRHHLARCHQPAPVHADRPVHPPATRTAVARLAAAEGHLRARGPYGNPPCLPRRTVRRPQRGAARRAHRLHQTQHRRRRRNPPAGRAALGAHHR